MTLPGSALPGQAPKTPIPSPLLEPDLLAADPAGLADVGRLVAEITREAATGLRRRSGPLPALTPEALTRLVDEQLPDGVVPRTGGGRAAVLALARACAETTVDLADPRAAAHLQPPSLAVAAAADVLAGIFNASVDTWDSGPYAVEIERRLVRGLASLAGFGPEAGGVLTPGGSASNLQALLIARDAATAKLRDVRADGLHGLGSEPVVFCSELAHFSVARACAILGLGEDAVRPVPTDARHRMRPEALDAMLRSLDPGRELPVAVVATAGTTDYGSIDPLPETAAVAREHGVRLHVDAAYGCGALFSDRLRPLLSGIEEADSVTLDLHKTAWQPAAASMLLVRDAGDFAATTGLRVAYLNPDDDGEAGYDGLLGVSLQTTRRADALKIAATLLALGTEGIGAMLDACHDLARHAEAVVGAHPRLSLTAGVTLSTVVFRYLTRTPADADAVNGELRRRLLREGSALIGRTDVPGDDGQGAVHLKLTLLNPQARASDIDELLDAVVRAGEAAEASAGAAAPGATAAAAAPATATPTAATATTTATTTAEDTTPTEDTTPDVSAARGAPGRGADRTGATKGGHEAP
ncbi:pyridoxal phosphate-dependent decarboxylase family protein [Streptomyces sp. SP18CS02]|uniref:pyridoxal phosphate-dependent decarboxylase family protein n=1 Tax=Streptomyces sp. SP18CS02 TaxID=3002531 RepID=UPI002E7891B5|nr:pyridoxal-dependent decarboxylase [Streptomyces sp. SP18CS02]MEE1756650.1 pyridoxal-dependent decarboxylase [Streptomyces sp. SP18CS02]